MTRVLLSAFVLSAHVVAFFTPQASAAVVYNDTFEDGLTDDPSNPTDLAWYRRFSTGIGTLTTGTDASLNNNGALLFNKIENSAANSALAVAPLPTTWSLVNIGDYIQMSFDIRANNGSFPANVNAIRFGLYNDMGTVVTADESTNSNDDQGYYAGIGFGSFTAGQQTYRELGTASPVMGATDRNTMANPAATSLGLSDQLKHSAMIRVERTATGILLTVGLGDSLFITNSELLATAVTNFNQVAISSGFVNSNTDFNIDNVVIDIQAMAIPEPTTWGALALGAFVGGCFLRRRAA